MSPIIFLDLPLNHELIENEIFGPILTINSFNNYSDAVNISNKTSYGLSAVICGKNQKRNLDIANKLEAMPFDQPGLEVQYGTEQDGVVARILARGVTRRAGAHDSPRHRAPSEPRHAGCGAAGAQRGLRPIRADAPQ